MVVALLKLKVQEQLHKLQEQQKSVNSNIEQYDKAVAALKSNLQ